MTAAATLNEVRYITSPASVQGEIAKECDRIKSMLLAKNEAYGSSAFAPLRIFSKSDHMEQLRVRIDDKLSRLLRGHTEGEDTVQDLIGYLILLRVAMANNGS